MSMNKRIALNWFDYISRGDLEAVCSIISPSWRMHGALPGMPAGREGVRMLLASFGPVRQHWTIEDIIEENGKVVLRATNHCFQENLLGIPSYGRPDIFPSVFIHHIKEGLIDETWRTGDDLGRMLQNGARILPAALSAG